MGSEVGLELHDQIYEDSSRSSKTLILGLLFNIRV